MAKANNYREILLVEDNANDVELTLEALSAHHLVNSIIVVNDGAAALDYVFKRGAYEGRKSGDPLVIFLDIKLPAVNGLEVLAALKSDERLRFFPVVVLTSSREESDLVRSYDLGANAYVVKPVNFQDFIKAVREVGGFWAILNEVPG